MIVLSVSVPGTNMLIVCKHSLQGLPVSPSVNDCEGQNTWRLSDVLRTALKASQALGFSIVPLFKFVKYL